jgi:hypothetical protein
MTEDEYIIVTNRVKVTNAKRIIAELTTGDECGVSNGQKVKLTAVLHTIEQRLFKKTEEIMT